MDFTVKTHTKTWEGSHKALNHLRSPKWRILYHFAYNKYWTSGFFDNEQDLELHHIQIQKTSQQDSTLENK